MNADLLVMRVKNWLQAATERLKNVGIATARLDALVLLEDALDKDRAHLLAHPDLELTAEQINKLGKNIKRRVRHEPLAYIRGKTEFYGREFKVTTDTLEPRPETETMIDLFRNLPEDIKTIVDAGTGSGCIAITTKLEAPDIEAYATDISAACIKVARENAKKHKVAVRFYEGDLLEPLLADSNPLTAILANLPYVPDNFTVNEAAMQEPKLAIFGGPDGLDLYRKLFAQASQLRTKPAFILTESLPFQHKELAQIARQNGFNLQTTEDFIQVFTV